MDEFADMLRAAGVGLLVDVRSIRRSRHNPQYGRDVLPDALAGYQIGYRPLEALGGRRPKSKTVPPEVNAWWTNQSFHNYADHALSDEFEAGLDELLTLAADTTTAIMCAEAVWWRCHRRIVADYALARGVEVIHLMAPNRSDPARLTPAAVKSDGKLVYPAADQANK